MFACGKRDLHLIEKDNVTVLQDYRIYESGTRTKDYRKKLLFRFKNIEKYEELRKTLFEKKAELNSELISEPILTKEEPTKSITKALMKKRLGIKQTRKTNISYNTFVFAKTHKNKK
mgnify:CR=1 FL=1